jgi:hypothetical protein
MDNEIRAMELLAQLLRLDADNPNTALRLSIRTADGEWVGEAALSAKAAEALTDGTRSVADHADDLRAAADDIYAHLLNGEQRVDDVATLPEFQQALNALMVEVENLTILGYWDRDVAEAAMSPYAPGVLDPLVKTDTPEYAPDPDDDLPIPEGVWDGIVARFTDESNGDA